MASPRESIVTMPHDTPDPLQVRQPDSQANNQVDNPPGPFHQTGSQPNNQSNNQPESKELVHTPDSGPSTLDILSFCAILIMLVWPWIFFSVVWAKKGIQMNNHVANVVTDNPHATTYFITLVCAIISMIVSALFSLAIIRFSQELVTYFQPTQPFHLTVLLAFRHQHWPWGVVKSVKYLLTKDRWWLAVLVIACILTFPQLTSSTTSLLTPGPFNRTAILTATELDFSSADADCLAWFEANPISNNCDYQSYGGVEYTSCLGENQMVDVLEAGRGNILELISNNSESLSYSQLGAQGGLRFLGSIQGVLPIGPNGVPAFGKLDPSPFSNPEIMAGMTSYNYTLNLQGLASNVSCSYTSTSPLGFQSVDPNSTLLLALSYNANCTALGQTEVLTNVPSLQSVNGNNTLAYWTCQSAPNATQQPSYFIYLRGFSNPQANGSYTTGIGNITCTVNPIQPAIFPVTYHSTTGIFATASEPITSSPLAFSTLLNDALIGLADIISEAQNFEANLVAESVITYGVKSFQLNQRQQSAQYLQLYERMIQGMIEYQTTYLRLIYSTVPNPPTSCERMVTGLLSYEVRGWFVTSANIGFLVPMTIINGGALVALFLAVIIAKIGGYKHHPLDPRPVIFHSQADSQELVSSEWGREVSLSPTQLLKEYFSSNVKNPLITTAENVDWSVAERNEGKLH